VIYEMATGKPAFSGKSRASLIAAILTAEPPSISRLQPLTPPALERVVKKCLAKDPDDRWQSARDIKTTLEWIDEGEDPAASSTLKHNPWRERAAWMLGLVLLSTMTFFADGHYRVGRRARAVLCLPS
jgi:serine/threonine protein kinase